MSAIDVTATVVDHIDPNTAEVTPASTPFAFSDPRLLALDETTRRTFEEAAVTLLRQGLDYLLGQTTQHAQSRASASFERAIIGLRQAMGVTHPVTQQQSSKGKRLSELLWRWGGLDLAPTGSSILDRGILFTLTEFPKGVECVEIKKQSVKGFPPRRRIAINPAEFCYAMAELGISCAPQSGPRGETQEELLAPRSVSRAEERIKGLNRAAAQTLQRALFGEAASNA